MENDWWKSFREEDYERKLANEEDAVPGESTEAEAGLATIKTSNALQAVSRVSALTRVFEMSAS